jgi:hypothetical protein
MEFCSTRPDDADSMSGRKAWRGYGPGKRYRDLGSELDPKRGVVGEPSFSECAKLTAIYFQGNAPSVQGNAPSVQGNDPKGLAEASSGVGATVYYLPGTTG